MKKALIFTLIFALIFSSTLLFTSCDQATEINKKNIKDYVNIQLVFGNVEQILCEQEDSKTPSLISKPERYLSCMCYIYVTPKSDYEFQNASISFEINYPTNYINYAGAAWTIDHGGEAYGYGSIYSNNGWSKTIQLDKNGYGVAAVRFKADGDVGHPLSMGEDWEISVTYATGNILN